MACRCTACSIAPLLGNPNRNTSVRITIHSFAFTAGSQTCACWRSWKMKSVPCAPLSHPLVEGLIGTIRREYFDQVFFWNAADLARKLNDCKIYYNTHRVHRSLGGSTPALRAGASSAVPILLDHHAWRPHCRGLFQTPIVA